MFTRYHLSFNKYKNLPFFKTEFRPYDNCICFGSFLATLCSSVSIVSFQLVH